MRHHLGGLVIASTTFPDNDQPVGARSHKMTEFENIAVASLARGHVFREFPHRGHFQRKRGCNQHAPRTSGARFCQNFLWIVEYHSAAHVSVVEEPSRLLKLAMRSHKYRLVPAIPSGI